MRDDWERGDLDGPEKRPTGSSKLIASRRGGKASPSPNCLDVYIGFTSRCPDFRKPLAQRGLGRDSALINALVPIPSECAVSHWELP